MIAKFEKRSNMIEVFPYQINHNEWQGDYVMMVLGLDRQTKNYTICGSLTLTDEEVEEMIQKGDITSPEQLVGRKMVVISNALCREAGITQYSPMMNRDEMDAINAHLKRKKEEQAENAPYIDLDDEGEEY